MAISHSCLTEPVWDISSGIANYEQLMGLLSMRRSRREFEPDAVPEEVVEKILAAAVQAPNAFNLQSVHYTIMTDKSVLKQLTDRLYGSIKWMNKTFKKPIARFLFRLLNWNAYNSICDLMPEISMLAEAPNGQDYILYNAPCLILVHTKKSDMCGSEDALYCAANILLAAEALGLGACVIGFVTGPSEHDPFIKKLAQIPKNHKVHTSIIIGYPKFNYSRPAPKKGPKTHFLAERAELP
jgi:nitroreductase